MLTTKDEMKDPDFKAIVRELDKRRDKLVRLRAKAPVSAKNLDDWYEIELIYSSNAIEGNTLTRGETAYVIHNRAGVAGKPLDYQKEAEDHYAALQLVKRMAREQPIILE